MISWIDRPHLHRPPPADFRGKRLQPVIVTEQQADPVELLYKAFNGSTPNSAAACSGVLLDPDTGAHSPNPPPAFDRSVEQAWLGAPRRRMSYHQDITPLGVTSLPLRGHSGRRPSSHRGGPLIESRSREPQKGVGPALIVAVNPAVNATGDLRAVESYL
jgi:hypothetical protein